MEGPRMSRGRGIDRPKRGPRELTIRLVSTATRWVFMVLEYTVVVVMPMLDGLFVEGGLLDGGMCSPQPSEGRNRLSEDHDQHQGMGHGTPQEASAIEEEEVGKAPRHRSQPFYASSHRTEVRGFAALSRDSLPFRLSAVSVAVNSRHVHMPGGHFSGVRVQRTSEKTSSGYLGE